MSVACRSFGGIRMYSMLSTQAYRYAAVRMAQMACGSVHVPKRGFAVDHMQMLKNAGMDADGTVLHLQATDGHKNIFLIGTAHISKRSAQQVGAVVRGLKPSSVMVELCQERADRLMASADGNITVPMSDMTKQLEKMQGMMPGGMKMPEGMDRLLPVAMDVFRAMGLIPGLEFKVAMEEAKRAGADIILGDRDQKETSKRLQSVVLPMMMSMMMNKGGLKPNVAISDKMREVFSKDMPLEQRVELLKNRDIVRELVALARDISPKLINVLLDERDELLTEALHRCKAPLVVGVVGLAHLDGIERRWSFGGHGTAISMRNPFFLLTDK